METYTSNDYRLYHYGILGMHWGQRNGPPYPLTSRTRSADENRSRRKGKTVSEDYARAHSKRPVEELSDKELRDILNRINMEKQYSKMNPNTIQKGENAVDNVLKKARYIVGAYGTYKALSLILKEVGSKLPAEKVVSAVADALGN